MHEGGAAYNVGLHGPIASAEEQDSEGLASLGILWHIQSDPGVSWIYRVYISIPCGALEIKLFRMHAPSGPHHVRIGPGSAHLERSRRSI